MTTKKIVLISFISILLLLCAYLAFMTYKKNELLNKIHFVDTELKQKTNDLLSESPEKEYSTENKIKVEVLRQKTDSLVGEIEKIKNHLLSISEDINDINEYLFKDKNIEKLKTDVVQFKDHIRTEFQNITLNQVDSKINTDDINENGKAIKWEEYYFKNAPLAAIFGQLDELTNSIKDTEKEILKQLS
jgi:hypothetical protein